MNVTVVVLWNVVASEACTPRRSTWTSYPVTATSVERSAASARVMFVDDTAWVSFVVA